MEIESDILSEEIVHVSEGDTVSEGSLIVVLDEDGKEAKSAPKEQPEQAPAPAADTAAAPNPAKATPPVRNEKTGDVIDADYSEIGNPDAPGNSGWTKH